MTLGAARGGQTWKVRSTSVGSHSNVLAHAGKRTVPNAAITLRVESSVQKGRRELPDGWTQIGSTSDCVVGADLLSRRSDLGQVSPGRPSTRTGLVTRARARTISVIRKARCAASRTASYQQQNGVRSGATRHSHPGDGEVVLNSSLRWHRAGEDAQPSQSRLRSGERRLSNRGTHESASLITGSTE